MRSRATTGAVDHVMNPAAILSTGIEVIESAGSRDGRGFIGPGGERIENEGEMKVQMEQVDDGLTFGATFQAADVTRALMSIAKICDSGPKTVVAFDSEKGVITRAGKEIGRFKRKNGLYTTQVRMRKPQPAAQRPATAPKPAPRAAAATATAARPQQRAAWNTGKATAPGGRPNGKAAGFTRPGPKR